MCRDLPCLDVLGGCSSGLSSVVCLPTACAPFGPHKYSGLIFSPFLSSSFPFVSPFIFPPVQINSRPSPRPAGGCTRQCGPCKGHHLWHPQGGVSGVHLVVGTYTSFLVPLASCPSSFLVFLPSVHPCFGPSVPQKLRK